MTNAKITDGTIQASKVSFPILKDYSTSEVDTGVKWTDGKPIYRKVFSFRVTSSAEMTSSVADLSINKIIRITGVYNADSNEYGPLYYWGQNDGIRAYIYGNMLRVQPESTYPSRPCYVYVILEYTKSAS